MFNFIIFFKASVTFSISGTSPEGIITEIGHPVFPILTRSKYILFAEYLILQDTPLLYLTPSSQ